VPETRHATFILTHAVEKALMRVLHDLEAERGRRVTWDQAFRRLLELAGRPVEEEPT
jgi:hypothetical protein